MRSRPIPSEPLDDFELIEKIALCNSVIVTTGEFTFLVSALYLL